MRIYLLRHGEAESFSSSDAQRQLTESGREQVRQVATLFAARESRPVQSVLVSPYLRARQTCDIFLATAYPQTAISTEVHDGITPDGSPRACIDYLAESAVESVLLVTHQPFVGAMLDLLTNGSCNDPISSNPPMLTSTLVSLEADVPAPGCAELRWYSAPPHQG